MSAQPMPHSAGALLSRLRRHERPKRRSARLPRLAPDRVRRRGICRDGRRGGAARAAGNDPRALGPARFAGQLRRRSVDLPLAPRTADFDVPLQPGRIRADRHPSARTVAQARNRNRSADHRALPARAARDRPDRRSIRSNSIASRQLQQLSRALGRVGVRPGVDSGPARRPDAPVRNAAAAAVARQFRSAGRPHAHAHGAVRFAGAEPAPHAAPGRAGTRQARAAARSKARRAKWTATCSSA